MELSGWNKGGTALLLSLPPILWTTQFKNHRQVQQLGPSSSNFLQGSFPWDIIAHRGPLQQNSTEGKVSSKKSQFRHCCFEKANRKTAPCPTGNLSVTEFFFLVKNIEIVVVLGGLMVWF